MRRFQLLVGLAMFAFGTAAHATIPGNIHERSREGLQHVCVDSEPGALDYVQCDAQVGGLFDAPYTAEECTAAGLAAACELDFVPGVRVKATVTIVYDDLPRDGINNAVDEQTALILDLKLDRKRVRIFELFEGSRLGNWNTIGVESSLIDGGIVYTDGSMSAFQFANGNLADLGDKIISLVDPVFPKVDLTETLPLVTSMTRVEAEQVDAPDEDPTATASVWKITLEFVRIRD
jgi:hypothetical protein